MAGSDQHIDYDLLAKYLAGECTEEEEHKVQQLITSNDEARKIVEQGQQLFLAPSTPTPDIKPTFDVNSAWTKVLSQIDYQSTSTAKPQSSQRFIQFVWKVAAMLVVGIGITLFFYLNRTKELQYSVAENETQEFYLPDSTKVILRNNSNLIAQSNYNQENREVELHGMAYFDVKRNEEKPFIISVNGGTVEVLGTAFLVNTKKENEVNVTVERGSVKLSSQNDPANSFSVLKKNQTATLLLDDTTISTKEILNLNELFWANKKLIYRQQPLQLVFEELEKIFQVEIEYKPETIENCRLSAMFRDEDFENILQNISLSMEFDYTNENGVYLITSNGCKNN